VAAREDGSRAVRDLALIGTSIGTLMAVALVVFRAHQNPPPRIVLGVACIAASWLVLNTVFTLRYARLYYTDPRGGVDVNQEDDPTFRKGQEADRPPGLHPGGAVTCVLSRNQAAKEATTAPTAASTMMVRAATSLTTWARR
jgi:uncharacterized membrane protein